MKHKTHLLTLLTIACCALSACNQNAGSFNLSNLSDQERELFEQASTQRKNGKNAEALELYTKAAKLSTGAVEAHVAIAQLLRSENKSAQSLPMLQDALILQPKDARLHTEKGFALIAQGKFAEAITSFDMAIALDAEQGPAYSGKGVALDLDKKHQEAQVVYAEAVARGLSSPSLDNNYALSLIFTGKYDEAIRLLEPHANAATATATMRQNLALAYGLKGDVGKALEYGEKDLDPISAKKNLEFYKRYSALKKPEPGAKIQTTNNDNAAHQAVPVERVEEGDVGFVAGSKGSEVVLKPNVDVVEMDDKAFQEIAK